MDLIFIARHFITSLTVQPHQLAIGSNELCWDIAPTGFATEQYSGDRIGIQFVRFGSQATLLRKLMGLTRMQQTELIPPTFQKTIEIFSRLVTWLPVQ
jgi:hypothetical protein